MRYLSMIEYTGHLPMVRSRDLSEDDIAKIVSFPSWPHVEAVYYALGRYPTGSMSLKNLDEKTPKDLFDKYVMIMDRLVAAIRVTDIPSSRRTQRGEIWYDIRPIDFVSWLAENDLPCDPRLFFAVVQNTEIKKKRTRSNEESVGSPILQLPKETDQELWREASDYILGGNLCSLVGMSEKAAGAKRTGTNIKLFKQKAYYRTRLYMKYGCKCLHPNLTELVLNDLKGETKSLNKKHKIPEYVEKSVIAALESDTDASKRVCNKRYPNGKSPGLEQCPFHSTWDKAYQPAK